MAKPASGMARTVVVALAASHMMRVPPSTTIMPLSYHIFELCTLLRLPITRPSLRIAQYI